MAKSQTKPKLDIVSDMFDAIDEESINKKYMFINRECSLQVYVDADSWKEAVNKFDTCQFKYPEEWEIYLRVKGKGKDTRN
tara:strand:- start:41 stop:283 length:243 start_codon:yes stop_codon:yes gene_type:complete